MKPAVRLPGPADLEINLACLADCKTLGMLASKRCEPKRDDARAGRLEAYPDGAREPLLGRLGLWEEDRGGRCWGSHPSQWHIGSPATARPLANEPFTPPTRRLRLVRKTASFTFGGEAARACLDLAVPKRRAKGKEEPSAACIHPHALIEAACVQKERPRRARARIKPHASSHEPLRTGQ